MVYARWISFFLMAVLLTGCATSTVIKDSRKTEIQITKAGELFYKEKTTSQQEIPALLRADRVKREDTIHILVPANKEERDYRSMRSLTDTLKRAGYGRIVFTTEKKALGILKAETR